MKPGNTVQTFEFDSEILRSGNFQLISITLDATSRYAVAGFGSGSVKIPKGTLIVQDTDLSDGTYNVVDTEAGNNGINGSATQILQDVVVLAETILDASEQDQPVKAYIKGTFDWSKIKYNYSGTTAITVAQVRQMQHLTFVDAPTS